jgi:putative DNA primase/helicase
MQEPRGKTTEHVPDPKRAPDEEFTEGALALRFADRHSGNLRYVAEWGKWYRWTGTKWEDEKTLYAFDLAQDFCREESARCHNQPHTAKTLVAAKTRAAVVSMVREKRLIAATINQWDTDLWLLNTPGGVVDLRTGTLSPHRPEDYMTKITAVAPGGDCPLFMQFLETITAGDKDLQTYLQRALGYALTGSVKEHALFFLYGTGSNGKSTLMNTVAGIMGDYYSAASIETFTINVGDRHPADLAALRGARLVVASETEEGRRGLKLGSSNSREATLSRRVSCGKIGSRIRRNTSCSSWAITNPACAP